MGIVLLFLAVLVGAFLPWYSPVVRVGDVSLPIERASLTAFESATEFSNVRLENWIVVAVAGVAAVFAIAKEADWFEVPRAGLIAVAATAAALAATAGAVVVADDGVLEVGYFVSAAGAAGMFLVSLRK